MAGTPAVDRTARVAEWLLPTLGGLLAIAAFYLTLFVRAGSLFGGDGDVGRHIRVGTDILLTRSIPRVDLYSHTMGGEHFVPYEWLSEVIFAWAHQVAGLAGVAILTGLLFTGGVAVVYVTMVRWGIPTFVAFAFGFAALLLQSAHLLPRPHLFTTLLVAVYALVLHEIRRGANPRWLLWLPVLMALWANVHGGFLLGFIVLILFGMYTVWQWWPDRNAELAIRIRWIGLTIALCFGASLLTPAGLELWPHTTGYLGKDFLVDNTQEYRSPDFHTPLGRIFMLALLYGVCALAWLRSRVNALGLASFVLFAAFALHSARNIPIFGVICVPWMAAWTLEVLRQPDSPARTHRFLGWAEELDLTTSRLVGWPFTVAALVVLSLMALRPDYRDVYRWDSERYPVAAVSDLGAIQGPGNVFNQFEWGGYLLYAAWPEVPVFIDGQTDFYGEELTKEYHTIRETKPGWRELLDEYGVGWALVPPDVPLATALELLPDWDLVYSDSTAVSFVRTEPPSLP